MTLDGGILDQVTQQFLMAFKKDGAIVSHAAQTVFYFLVTIQVAGMGIKLAIAGESLDRLIEKIVMFLFAIGFYDAMIQYGGEWIPYLLNGFIEVGQQADVSSLDPSSLIAQGMSISGAIFKGFFNWGLLGHPFVSSMGVAVCITIIIIYALMAAELAISLIKSYALISVGGLFFAFGASDFTHDLMKSYFKAIVGLGLKLMMLYLILSVGQTIGADWAIKTDAAAKNHELMPMLAILAAVIVYYQILKNIPTFIAGLAGVGGLRNYGDAAIGMAINAGFQGARLASGGGYFISQSAKMSAQLFKAGGHIAQSYQAAKVSFTGTSNHLGSVTKTLGTSAFNTVRDMAMKQNQHLNVPQKFNQHMANHVKQLQKSSHETSWMHHV